MYKSQSQAKPEFPLPEYFIKTQSFIPDGIFKVISSLFSSNIDVPETVVQFFLKIFHIQLQFGQVVLVCITPKGVCTCLVADPFQ